MPRQAGRCGFSARSNTERSFHSMVVLVVLPLSHVQHLRPHGPQPSRLLCPRVYIITFRVLIMPHFKLFSTKSVIVLKNLRQSIKSLERVNLSKKVKSL